MSTVVVIGAGLAGLSAACHLVSQGHRVLVIEKESGPGGRALRIRQDGFTFDLGPTVMTMPELLDEPLRAIGSSQQKAVPMRQLDPAYRGVFADHSELLIRNSTEATAQHIHHLCGPHDAQALRELEPFLAELYTTALPHFIDTNFDSPLDLLRSPQAALKLLKMGAFAPMAKMINTRISDERLRRMLTFQALYAGLSPTTALGVYALITYMDTFRGVYLPEGGMGAIPHGMAQALAPHATIHYDTTVHSLMRGRGGRTVGVNTNDGPIPADAVICTIDTPTAYRYLLPGT
ncbi:phytoene desaturase family protein, partial [Dermatophilus congolensis]|uniref:phytoene desaturase family protein n=1 Tax=Dermatophilus congolensis TaxID=1863 RepID=UPI001FB94BDB